MMDFSPPSPIFIGRVADDGQRMTVIGRTGSVSIKGTDAERAAAREFLKTLTERSPLTDFPVDDSLVPTLRVSLLSALEEVEAVVDLTRAWAWFHTISSNPATIPLGHDPMTAYKMPRLVVAGEPCAFQVPPGTSDVDDIANRRCSADLERVSPDPGASLRAAVRLAMNAYALRPDRRRPAASGGALYPLHLWVLGADDDSSPRRILGLDTERRTIRLSGTITNEELRQLFIPDPAVDTALARGVAVIVIAADPRRVTHKYGNRGWRFPLMECGAITHHITLAATSFGDQVRPIAGYYDDALKARICDQAYPLLTILVAADS